MLARARSSGDAIVFTAAYAFADPQAGSAYSSYLARRDPNGWSTTNLSPPRVVQPLISPLPLFTAFSADLEQGVVLTGDPAPAPGATAGIQNLFRRDNQTNGYTTLTTAAPPGAGPFYQPIFAAASEDFSHVTFEADGALTPDAPEAARNLYESTPSGLRLVSILPNGTPSPGGATAASVPVSSFNSVAATDTLSADGSRALFTAPADFSSPAQLYVRLNGDSTLEASKSQRGVPDPNGPQAAVYQTASTDGNTVFFTSAAKLTDDATTGPTSSGSDLYRYDVSSETLTDLTVDANPANPNGAEVLGVVGAADDGSYVYFAARGDLDDGAISGAPNLYAWHDGEVDFITTLKGFPLDYQLWSRAIGDGPPNETVTPDGRGLVFKSFARVTSYDNAGHSEVYVYSAGDGSVTCASCSPDNAAATGDAFTRPDAVGNGPPTKAHNLTDDSSRVFFQTPEALVAADTNNRQDVYQYNLETDTAALISSGRSPVDSNFYDASGDGRDVFFVTSSKLVAADTEDAADLYNARAGGGFAAQNQPGGELSPCSGEDCKSSFAAPPATAYPASSVFSGPRNATHRKQGKQKHRKHRKQGKHRKHSHGRGGTKK